MAVTVLHSSWNSVLGQCMGLGFCGTQRQSLHRCADPEITQIDAAEGSTLEESLIARAEGLLAQGAQMDVQELRFGRPPVNLVAGDRERALGPDEFSVEVYKTGHGAGLEIECARGMLLVANLKPHGPIQAWNALQGTDSDRTVKGGDRIVSVNGVEGDGNFLIERLRTATSLRLVLRRAKCFDVKVTKTEGGGLGMCVISGNTKLDTLKIVALRHGAVGQWNQRHPDRAVCEGDRVVSVNDISGDPDAMLEELKFSTKLRMSIIRPA